MSGQCADNAADRATGETWERAFCELARDHGKVFTPHQIGTPNKSAAAYGPGEHGIGYSTYLLPDVTVWTAPGEHHEIKHKNQDRSGCYGLERYRLDALVRWANTTGQDVFYTIHDWELAGATNSRDPVPNRIEHWRCANVSDLAMRITTTRVGTSWIGGVKRDDVRICYWTARRNFQPLSDLWAGIVDEKRAG